VRPLLDGTWKQLGDIFGFDTRKAKKSECDWRLDGYRCPICILLGSSWRKADKTLERVVRLSGAIFGI
jgi:hypothetical protein